MRFIRHEFYDQEDNFQKYMARRQSQENANDTLEKPIMWELVGDVSDKNILDLGCGDASFGIELLNHGCSLYVGVEASHKMFQAASRTLEGHNGSVVQATMEDWAYPEEAFDLVISRLAIHYIEDVAVVFRNIYQTLKPNGRFVFSVEHPVITSTLQTSGTRTHWIVDQYFVNGYREQQWLGGTVHKFHRTIEDYFVAMQEAGFTVEHLRESRPRRNNFLNQETYERRLRIPLFLFLSGKK
jgi:SAM-dependent methyltransferase